MFYYDIARKVGVDKIAEMAHRFGLGERFGIELDGENKGIVPDKAWKRRTLGQPWHDGETLVVGIGQGYMLSTPLQLATMTARIANGGFAVTPSVLRENVPPVRRASAYFEPMGVSQTALKAARDGMVAVMEGARGTARASKIKEWPGGLAGKTGTSQVKRITMADRARGIVKNEDRPWKDRDHSLFVAYGPIQDPAYAIAVVVEHGGGGSAVAAPIASDIMREVMRHDPCSLIAGVPEALRPGRDDTTGETEQV